MSTCAWSEGTRFPWCLIWGVMCTNLAYCSVLVNLSFFDGFLLFLWGWREGVSLENDVWNGCVDCVGGRKEWVFYGGVLLFTVNSSCPFLWILSLIKHTVILFFCHPLSVHLVDWQPCTIPLLLYVLFSSSSTQWSVSVPKLCSSPFLNHCRPASCILHGTLPSIMRSSSGLGTSCQSVCMCAQACVCVLMKQRVCVSICTQTGSSIRGSATTIEE